MKKVIPIIGIVAMTIPITPPLYASCSTFFSGCSTTANGNLNTSRCSDTSSTCYGFTENGNRPSVYVKSCSGCTGKNSLVASSVQLSPSCTATYYTCACTACNSSNCKSTDWSGNGSSQTRTVKNCDSNCECISTTERRCNAGYYGNGITCTRCPQGTSSAGTTSITGCCISAGASGSDSTGSYRYTSECCY